MYFMYVYNISVTLDKLRRPLICYSEHYQVQFYTGKKYIRSANIEHIYNEEE